MTIYLTYTEIKEALEKAVFDRGEDFVYTKPEGSMGCRYFDQASSPSCIIGHVLAQKGVQAFQYEEEVNQNGIGGLLDHHIIRLKSEDASNYASTDRAYHLMRAAQDAQDRGTSWGESVKLAMQVTADDHYIATHSDYN